MIWIYYHSLGQTHSGWVTGGYSAGLESLPPEFLSSCICLPVCQLCGLEAITWAFCGPSSPSTLGGME